MLVRVWSNKIFKGRDLFKSLLFVFIAIVSLDVLPNTATQQDQLDEIKALLDRSSHTEKSLNQTRELIAAALRDDTYNPEALTQLSRWTLICVGVLERCPRYGAWQRAQHYIDMALKHHPNHPEPLILAGHIYAATDQLEQALSYLDQAEAAGTDNPWLHINRAVALRKKLDKKFERNFKGWAKASNYVGVPAGQIVSGDEFKEGWLEVEALLRSVIFSDARLRERIAAFKYLKNVVASSDRYIEERKSTARKIEKIRLDEELYDNDEDKATALADYAIYLANNTNNYQYAEKLARQAMAITPDSYVSRHALAITLLRQFSDKFEEDRKTAIALLKRSMAMRNGFAIAFTNLDCDEASLTIAQRIADTELVDLNTINIAHSHLIHTAEKHDLSNNTTECTERMLDMGMSTELRFKVGSIRRKLTLLESSLMWRQNPDEQKKYIRMLLERGARTDYLTKRQKAELEALLPGTLLKNTN